MATLADVRSQYPEYSYLSDTELAQALHRRFYADVPFGDFAKRVGLKTSAESLKATNPAEYDPASPEFRSKYGAADPKGNFWAGVGKGMTDVAQGVGQLVGLQSREDVKAKRAQDADLMATTSGKVGNVAGLTAAMLPAAFIPGANTLAGSAAIGAGTGLLMPSGSTDETLSNVGWGAVTAPATILGGRALGAAYRGGKSLVEPFTKGGQERIAARSLRAFAGGDAEAQAAANALRGTPQTVPGYAPTAAELANNAGVAQLERTVRNNPEYLNAFSARDTANRTALRDAIGGIARSPAEREAAVAARQTATDALYTQADNALVRADADFGKLLMRPSMKQAVARAEQLANEAGDAFANGPEMTGQNLHYVKKALDDLVSGAEGNERAAIAKTREAFLGWLDNKLAPYQQARTTFADMSKPINRMDVGQALAEKLTPAMGDFGADKMTPAAYAAAVRAGDATAAKATGFGGAKLANVLTPDELGTVNTVGQTLARRDTAANLGRATGSNTAQNLVSQNILRQFFGPLGLPESALQRAVSSTFAQSLLRPAQWAGKLGEPKVMGLLADAMMDPATAARLLEMGVDPTVARLLWAHQGLLASPALASVYAGQQ